MTDAERLADLERRVDRLERQLDHARTIAAIRRGPRRVHSRCLCSTCQAHDAGLVVHNGQRNGGPAA